MVTIIISDGMSRVTVVVTLEPTQVIGGVSTNVHDAAGIVIDSSREEQVALIVTTT